jgi:hypothetical protein
MPAKPQPMMPIAPDASPGPSAAANAARARPGAEACAPPGGHRRRPLARIFKGLTWRRLLIVGLLVLAEASIRIPLDLMKGESASFIAQRVSANFGSMLLMFMPVLLAVIAADNLAPRDRRGRTLALAIALGVAAGMALKYSIYLLSSSVPHWTSLAVLAGGWVNGCFLAAITTVIYFFVVREDEAHDTLHLEQLGRLSIERDMTEARLQVMQAQIEPHFL